MQILARCILGVSDCFAPRSPLLSIFSAFIYSCSRSYVKSKRRKNDPLNDVIGVGAAGFAVGLPRGPVPAVACGLSLAAASSALV